MIKDEILLKSSFSLIFLRCFYCKSFKHTIKLCPFLHYIADREKAIKQSEFYFEEPRKKISRRKISKFSKIELVNTALKFQETQEEKKNPLPLKYQMDDIPENPRFESLEFLEDEENASSDSVSLLGDKKEIENNKFKEKENDNDLENTLKKEKEPFFSPEIKKEILGITENISEISGKPNRNSFLNQKNSFFDNTASEISNNKQKCPSTLVSRARSKFASYTQFSSCQIPIERNKDTTIIQTVTDVKKEKFIYDRMKYYKSYYPKMNFLEVIQNINKNNIVQQKFKEFTRMAYPDNTIKKEIGLKIQKMQKYTIYFGKIYDLLMNNIIKHLRFEMPTISSQLNSPNGFKRKKTFQGFFDRNHVKVEKDFKSLISAVIKSSKGSQKALPKQKILSLKVSKSDCLKKMKDKFNK